MSERIKSLSEKKIEKSLGISADDLSDLDDNNVESPGDSDKAKIDLKKEQAKIIQDKLSQLSNLDDKEFAKQMYKQLAVEGFGLLQMTKSEMEIDPSPRYVEVLATLSNAVVSATDSFRSIETTEKQFELEEKKLALRDKSPTSITQNIAFSGTLQDLMKQIDAAEQQKVIEVQAEVIGKPQG